MGLGLQRWPTRAPQWAHQMVGLPTEALDDLSTVPELIAAALRGESNAEWEPPAVDPGDTSRGGLQAGWASGTTLIDLERAEHWVVHPPKGHFLPLRRSYAPDLYDFLIAREKFQFAALAGGRHPLVPAGLLQDAGFVAAEERRRRSGKPRSARREVRLLVLGLRAKYQPGPISI
jgi:hypothetical protein